MDPELMTHARDAAEQSISEIDKKITDLQNRRRLHQAAVDSLNELLQEYEEIKKDHRALLDETIEQVRPAVLEVVAAVTTDELLAESRLTDACRTVLGIAPNTGVQVTEFVRMLQERGFDTERYASPVSAVQTVLKRLCKAGMAKVAGKTTGGRPLYAPTERGLVIVPTPHDEDEAAAS